MDKHKHLLKIVKKLPTDYQPWGEIKRWEDENKSYPDCSGGCKHFVELQGELGYDCGVCTKKDSPRVGLLTFEHQAGLDCFEQGEQNEK